jgi:ABC-type lipoprotein export system ATPase subunit
MAATAAASRTFDTQTQQQNMIELEGIEKIYRADRIETVALSNINLSVRAGEFISIMGPSGSGKSTLLNVIGLLDAPSGDKVSISGLYPSRLATRVQPAEALHYE